MVYIFSFICVNILIIWELFYDKKLIKAFEKDGRSVLENSILHSYQLPIRSLIIFISSLLISNKIEELFYINAIYGLYFWIVFDILFNIIILNKPYNYMGSTAESEKIISKVFKKNPIIIKTFLLIVFIILYLNYIEIINL